jgi:hypothetical protein
MWSRATGATRLAGVAATVVAAAGLVGLAGTAPAAAAETTPGAAPSVATAAACRIQAGGPTFNADRATVTAFRFRVCGPEVIVDLPVSISRNGRQVASGEGIVAYQCRGTAVGEFSANGGPPRSFPCG